jgi:hypothetical protein
MWVQHKLNDELQCAECGELIKPYLPITPVTAWLLINIDEGLIVQRVLCDPCYQHNIGGEGAMLVPLPNTTDGSAWREPVLTAAGRAKLAEIQGG